MPDYYHAPALILTVLLLPAFGALYLRFRDTRTLLWFLGFLCAIAHMVLYYMVDPWQSKPGAHPWLSAAGQIMILVSSGLFLGSLSPVRFRLGRLQVLYVIPYTIPLVADSILLSGICHCESPSGPMFLILPAVGVISLIVTVFWNLTRASMPVGIGIAINLTMGAVILGVYFAVSALWAMNFILSANLLMTAILLMTVFRRFSPGVILSVFGFTAWSLSALEIFPAIARNSALNLNLVHIIVLGKVVAAMGMILIALEDELAINKAAQERERRARLELEAYTGLILSRRRLEDFDRQGTEICQTVVDNSRFSQAALLLETGGRYRLSGAAGLDAATVAGLGLLATRIPVTDFLVPGSADSAVDHSQTLRLDLSPWLRPGDDLARLRFPSALAVPMVGRSNNEGALLLSGMRPIRGNSLNHFQAPLRADDLLPIEMLTARLQATRSQTTMLEKLIDSEKFAGLGQLAGSVTQQLNNPLTVILGYGSLLEESTAYDSQDRKGVEAILIEARRMKSTLESLLRISRPHGSVLTPVSVAELLGDMEQLHRPEFLRRSIEFQLCIGSTLPKVLCNAQQLRQAVLHCLQYAIESVETQGGVMAPNGPKSIRLEATSEGNLVQILVSHSGPGFVHPESAFDPFTPAHATGETVGLGLSLCATILREHNGRASAINLEPRGAALILELQAA